MPRFSSVIRTRPIAAVLALSSLLAACSDLYYDRRETIAFGANDAVTNNIAVQTINPWPVAAANNNFTTNGPRMAGAIQRYRTGRIIQPVGTSTSSVNYATSPQTEQGGSPAATPTSGSTASPTTVGTPNN